MQPGKWTTLRGANADMEASGRRPWQGARVPRVSARCMCPSQYPPPPLQTINKFQGEGYILAFSLSSLQTQPPAAFTVQALVWPHLSMPERMRCTHTPCKLPRAGCASHSCANLHELLTHTHTCLPACCAAVPTAMQPIPTAGPAATHLVAERVRRCAAGAGAACQHLPHPPGAQRPRHW